MSVSPFSTGCLMRSGPFYLTPFDNLFAPVVARWVPSERELFMLAPKTEPPLTAAKVVAWQLPGGQPLLFYHDGIAEPLGYVELNPMPGDFTHLWLGHCVIRPDCRGRKFGRKMVALAIEQAFVRETVKRISLVVFPENPAAMQCYRDCGFQREADEYKVFATTGRRHHLVRMTLLRSAVQPNPNAK